MGGLTWRGRLLPLAVAFFVLLSSGAAVAASSPAGNVGVPGRDFFVSPAGSDANAGTSATAPWRTLAQVDSARLLPGDRVHLQAGARFDEPLAPYAGMAGTSSAPITFDSYGSGHATLDAGIYLNSVSNLVFDRLDVTSTRKGVFSSAGGTGVRGIKLSNLTISNVPLAGISSNNRSDSSWIIDGVTITHTGDSGIYFVGSNFTISRSHIVDTGTNASVGYPRHGIYAAGPAPTILNNIIEQSSTSGISLRYQDSLVQGNRIRGAARGVSFEEQADVAGRTRILFNTISDVSDSGIVVARPAIESFVVADNTIERVRTYGMYFQTVSNLTITNNIVDTGSGTASLLSVRRPTRSFSEHNNLWNHGSRRAFYWNGVARDFNAYRRASGAGLADRFGDPKLGADLTPKAGSPAVDSGSTKVDSALTYRGSCDGIVFHYCGTAPDLGAHERR